MNLFLLYFPLWLIFIFSHAVQLTHLKVHRSFFFSLVKHERDKKLNFNRMKYDRNVFFLHFKHLKRCEEDPKLYVYANDSICQNHCYLYDLLCILFFLFGSQKRSLCLLSTSKPIHHVNEKREINADRRSRNNVKAATMP